MPQLIHCPECGKSLRIPDERINSIVKCPGCDRKFRATEASASSADSDDADIEPDDPKTRRRKPLKSKAGGSESLQPFLRRWLVVCGIVLAVALLFGIGGLFSEPLAIIASVICVVAILGFALGGMIWMAIDLGRENLLLGAGVLFMPPIGLVTAYQKPGPARRGAIVYLSLLAPLTLLGLMLLVFYPMYVGAGRQSGHAAKWNDLMHQLDAKVTPTTPEVAVTVRVASNPGALDGLEPRCEALLRPFKSYVQGSLKIDAAARQISYRYRGSENFNTMIAFYLGSATGAFTPLMPVAPAAN